MNEDLILPRGIRALCRAAKKDPKSGGMLRAFFGDAAGSGELWARHTIQALSEAPESTFPKTDLYILLPNEDGYDLSHMLFSQLEDVDGHIQCLGNAGERHFLYHVRFTTTSAAEDVFVKSSKLSEELRVRRFEVHPEQQAKTGFVVMASREFLRRAHSFGMI